MGVGGFFPGGTLEYFSKIFLEGSKSGKGFSHSKLRKQTFLLKFSKSGGTASLPTLSTHPEAVTCTISKTGIQLKSWVH